MMLYALEETLDKIQLPRHRPGKKPLLTAADLGCSCGHNTLLIADVIVDHMTKLCGTGSLKWYVNNKIKVAVWHYSSVGRRTQELLVHGCEFDRRPPHAIRFGFYPNQRAQILKSIGNGQQFDILIFS
jgi:hypothetical protein